MQPTAQGLEYRLVATRALFCHGGCLALPLCISGATRCGGAGRVHQSAGLGLAKSAVRATISAGCRGTMVRWICARTGPIPVRRVVAVPAALVELSAGRKNPSQDGSGLAAVIS